MSIACVFPTSARQSSRLKARPNQPAETELGKTGREEIERLRQENPRLGLTEWGDSGGTFPDVRLSISSFYEFNVNMTPQALPARQLVVLGCTVFAAITTELLPVGLLPLIARGLEASERQVGWLISIYAIVVAVGAVPMAALSRRWPRRLALCVLLSCYGLSSVAITAASTFGILVSARALAGLAHAGLLPIALALAVDLSPPSRSGRAIAFVNGGNVLALVLGVPLSTALGTALGWRWPFALASAATLLLVGVVLVAVPAGNRPATSEAPTAIAMLRRPALLTLAAAVAVLTLGHYTAYSYVSPLLARSGVGLDAVSLVLFGYGSASLLGLAFSGRYADSRPHAVLATAALVAVVSLSILTLTDTPAPAVAATVTWGAAFGALPTLAQTIALRAAPEDSVLAPAVVNSTWNIGIGGGAAIGGSLILTSPATVTTVAAALMMLGLIALVATFSTTRRGARP
jgi:predicted MFS family arabinose efflux permease